MRAISLWEPWASAIAIGAKKNETRGWATNYRGELAIHAAKTTAHAHFIHDPRVIAAFSAANILSVADLPFGCVVATCRLAKCLRVEDIRQTISPLEWELGNYNDGRFAWVLEDVVRLPQPVPARGAQGFWNWSTP